MLECCSRSISASSRETSHNGRPGLSTGWAPRPESPEKSSRAQNTAWYPQTGTRPGLGKTKYYRLGSRLRFIVEYAGEGTCMTQIFDRITVNPRQCGGRRANRFSSPGNLDHLRQYAQRAFQITSPEDFAGRDFTARERGNRCRDLSANLEFTGVRPSP